MSVRPLSPPINPLSVIDRLIEQIELSQTQHAQVKQSYGGVTGVLQKDGAPIRAFEPFNCAQGSMRIGTTVRPPAQEEHDLDVLCRLNASGALCRPSQIYELVWGTLDSDGTYKGIMERRRRCIRIIYARQFHLDITPAIPDWLYGTQSLYVPDRELQSWCSTHPIGFADSWFMPISERRPIITSRGLLTANSKSFAAQIEPLPEFGAFDKTPLQRTVQLVKYDRDRYYLEDEKHRPSSILLTTLTARAYESELPTPAHSLLEFVIRVIKRIPQAITVTYNDDAGPRYGVLNPVNSSENFAENWTSEHYQRFLKWHEKLLKWIGYASAVEGQGTDVLLNRMSEEFGKERVLKAAKSFGQQMRESHETGNARVSVTGKIGSVGAALGSTVFYGA